MKSKKRKHSAVDLKGLKRGAIVVLWIVVVVLALASLLRRAVSDTISDYNLQLATNEREQLEVVITPESLKDNQRVDYKGFTVYYNKSTHLPNYVVYELTGKETLGKLPRFNNFVQDEQVAGCPEPWQYSRSGYDRGHMVPAGDLKWDRQAMEHSFMMTNVCPQVKDLNEGLWNDLEEQVRQWARRDSALIIVAGPIVGSNPVKIGKRGTRIAVPDKFFKVILSPYTTPPSAIAFVMENKPQSGSLRSYATTVDAVEYETGLDFFSALPDDIEDCIESENNVKHWFKH